MNKSESKSEKQKPERRFSRQHWEMLKYCSGKKDERD
jgi:hypothetical protein